eukprot:scaffold5067_cov245-Pinguiococcus_pyrenoidosus.AAC.6
MVDGSIEVDGHAINAGELMVSLEFSGDAERYVASAGKGEYSQLVVILDTEQDEALLAAGTARECVNRVQRMRKTAGLEPSDEVEIFLYEEHGGEGAGPVTTAIKANAEYCRSKLRTLPLPMTLANPFAQVIAVDTCDFELPGDRKVHSKLMLTRPCLAVQRDQVAADFGNVDIDAVSSLLTQIGVNNGVEEAIVTLDGKRLDLKKGVHFFETAKDMISSEQAYGQEQRAKKEDGKTGRQEDGKTGRREDGMKE